ncbi:MAG: class I SAM-dependent methyltransferase, partial [bacterium]
DCTLGLACDALVAAAHAGDGGEVVGLERNLLLHTLVSDGLREYGFSSPALAGAARRIRPVLVDHLEYLESCEKKSFDVVYFDPFFEKTVPASASMQVMREVSELRGLSAEAVEAASRVARKRVVVKCRRGEFGKFEFDRTIEAGNRVIYGIIDL